MTATVDSSLQSAMEALAIPGIVVGHRLISVGDEHALMPAEAGAFARSVVKVRRASGAARIVARALLAQSGHAGCAVPRSAAGDPIWPAGIIGSLAHDARVAVAAIAPQREIAAVGIDIEPAEDLPAELLEMVATPGERRRIDDQPYGGRLLFVAKEAVYKAVYPLDRTFLEHHDVEVSISARKAVVRNGREVALRYCISSHLVVLAFLPAAR